MSDASLEVPATKLGVLTVISDSISMFGRRFIFFILLSVIVSVGLNFLNYLIFGATLFVSPEEMFSSSAAIAAFVSTMLIALLASTMVTAIITMAAYDTRQNKPMRIGAYIGLALKCFLPILVLSMIVGLGAGLGMMLLVIPGLYLYAMWSVTVPAIVIERAGFSAMGRSSELTKGYRWSILGLLILVFVMVIVVNMVLGTVLGFGFAASLGGDTSGLSVLIFQAAVNAVGTSFLAVVVVMLYARLKEIKEGVGMEDLADIFS